MGHSVSTLDRAAAFSRMLAHSAEALLATGRCGATSVLPRTSSPSPGPTSPGRMEGSPDASSGMSTDSGLDDECPCISGADESASENVAAVAARVMALEMGIIRLADASAVLVEALAACAPHAAVDGPSPPELLLSALGFATATCTLHRCQTY